MFTYSATIVRIIDGDTLLTDIDLGFYVRTVQHLRLLGCNARELAQAGGREARDNLATLLPAGTSVVVRSVKPDKYSGRYDAAVTLPDGRDLVATLITDGWCAPWDGHGPKPVPPWPRGGFDG